MKAWGRATLMGMVVLAASGCIPRGAPSGPFPAAEGPPSTHPRLETPQISTVFDERPVWESRPVTASAQIVGPQDYVVQAGDTLSRIGERTGAGAEAIARFNDIPLPYTIRVGQRLIIPQGRYHSVAQGESGIAIARAYGVPWSQIVELNGLSEPYRLQAGQHLLLPPDASEAARIDQRAAAFKLDIDDILTGGEPAYEPGDAPLRPIESPTRALPPSVVVRPPAQFSGSFDWPAYGKVTNRFGSNGPGEVNDGIDILVAQGTPILASSDGVVAFVGSNVAGYGGVILLRHGQGWISAYGRAASATVTRGQSVRKGQIIGRAGSGATPLLHFELRQGRKPVDPATYLPRQ